MQDLTKITTPFGLLDTETQEALRAHGGPYEVWDGDEWLAVLGNLSWCRIDVYRVKPQPPKPREMWLSPLKSGGFFIHENKDLAIDRGWTPGVDCFLFREVLE